MKPIFLLPAAWIGMTATFAGAAEPKPLNQELNDARIAYNGAVTAPDVNKKNARQLKQEYKAAQLKIADAAVARGATEHKSLCRVFREVGHHEEAIKQA